MFPIFYNAFCKAQDYGIMPFIRHLCVLLPLVIPHVRHVCVLLFVIPHVRHVCILLLLLMPPVTHAHFGSIYSEIKHTELTHLLLYSL